MARSRGHSPVSSTAFEPVRLDAASWRNFHALIHGPGISVFHPQPKERHLKGRHEHAATILITHGAPLELAWSNTNSQRLEHLITEESIVLVPPGVLHHLSGKADLKLIAVYLSPSWLAQFTPGQWASLTINKLSDWKFLDPLLGQLILELTTITHARANTAHILALAHSVAARVCDRKTSRPTISRRLSPATLERVDQFILARLNEKIRVSAVAREARYSQSHFNVLLQASTGLSCEQYILRHRLLRAKALLQTGHFNVGQVAHATGFCDHSHLTTQFSKLFGAPPRAFISSTRTV